MKLLKPFNLIMFVLIPIIMFFGFTLRSYAADSGTITISQTTGTSKNQFSGINGYYTISSGTAYTDDKYTKISNITLNVKSSTSVTFTRPLSVELHLVTTEGDFVLTGNKLATLATTNVSIKGTGYGTSFAGVPIAYYCIVDYQCSTNITITISGSFDWVTEYDDQQYWHTTINGHVVDTLENTNTIIQMLDDLGNGNVSWYKVSHNSAVETATYRWDLYKYQLTRASGQATSGTITFSSIPDNVNVYLYCSLANGELALINSFNESNINSSGVLTISYLFSNDKKVFEYMPLDFFICVEGVDRSNFTFTFPTNFTVITSFKAEFSDWSTIKNSQELADLNNTSDSVGTIISDNNNFESSAFTDFSDNLEEFGFDDWSLVPISSELTTTKNIITMFYNILPFKVQWLFTSVMALGLIVMLLTVGTRVVQRTGEFTRAKPVKMKNSISHKKG